MDALGDLLYLFGTIFAVSAGICLGVGGIIALLLWIAGLGQSRADGKHANGTEKERS